MGCNNTKEKEPALAKVVPTPENDLAAPPSSHAAAEKPITPKITDTGKRFDQEKWAAMVGAAGKQKWTATR